MVLTGVTDGDFAGTGTHMGGTDFVAIKLTAAGIEEWTWQVSIETELDCWLPPPQKTNHYNNIHHQENLFMLSLNPEYPSAPWLDAPLEPACLLLEFSCPSAEPFVQGKYAKLSPSITRCHYHPSNRTGQISTTNSPEWLQASMAHLSFLPAPPSAVGQKI